MFALGNRRTTRRKHHKSAEGRRRDHEFRAAYKTQLRIEPLEDRRLLSVFAVTNMLDGSVRRPAICPAVCGRPSSTPTRIRGRIRSPSIRALTAARLP